MGRLERRVQRAQAADQTPLDQLIRVNLLSIIIANLSAPQICIESYQGPSTRDSEVSKKNFSASKIHYVGTPKCYITWFHHPPPEPRLKPEKKLSSLGTYPPKIYSGLFHARGWHHATFHVEACKASVALLHVFNRGSECHYPRHTQGNLAVAHSRPRSRQGVGVSAIVT